MTCSEDAAELRVEHVLCHHPGTEEFRVKVGVRLKYDCLQVFNCGSCVQLA